MSYPPPGAQPPAALGAPPVAKVLLINRNAADARARGHRAYHSLVGTADELWRILAAAAAAAAAATAAPRGDDERHAHAHLWRLLDPPLASKSAAVKAIAQATSLELLLGAGAPAPRLGAPLREWMQCASVVAHGMHRLFLAGVHEWNVGLVPDAQHQHAVDPPNAVARDAWAPFETYDRTADSRYANCFGESAAQRFRSRVAIDQSRLPPEAKAATRKAWQAALAAHARMLELEAKHGLFAPDDAACQLTAAEVGGLFLLTNLPDNWTKRHDLFDAAFWKLRLVHFGIERNTGLRIGRFSLKELQRPRGDDGAPLLLRQSAPDPMRSYCWLDNALHTMVALKVLIFWKLRAHAYDRAEHRTLTTDAEIAALVRVDRHDIDQAKSHWLPSTRSSAAPRATTTTTTKRREPSPPPKQAPTKRPRPAPTTAPSALAPAPPPLLERVVAERRAAASLVAVSAALAAMAAERFALRLRIDALDRMVGMHLAQKRLFGTERGRLQAEAVEQMDALAERCDDPALAPCQRAAAEAQMEAITKSFDLDNLRATIVARMRRIAATEGMLWRRADRIWATDQPAVLALARVDLRTTAGDEDVFVRIPFGEWGACFGADGEDGAYGLAARCDPADGWARREARSLADRLVALLRHEAEYRALESSDALVPMPIECRAGVAVRWKRVDAPPTGPLPDHIKAYKALQREEAERRRAFGAFVDACRRTMARAIRRCFEGCMAEASSPCPLSDDDDRCESDSTQLVMPARLFSATQTVATDIVHRFLNVAHAFGGLLVVDDALAQVEDPCILVYHRATKRLIMPNSETVVECFWEATQHLLDLAVRAEPWIRNRRRRVDATLVLSRLERWVTVDRDTGPHVHGHARESAVLEGLERGRAERREAYWPAWPPREYALCTPGRIRTAVRWGRHAACRALCGRAEANELKHVPNEPYHGGGGGASSVGEHVWLHKAHAETMLASEQDDEVDDFDLFGEDSCGDYEDE